MSHAQPCALGFGGAPCPQCAYVASVKADRARVRAELHRRIDALDDPTRDELLTKAAEMDPDLIRDALNEIGHGE